MSTQVAVVNVLCYIVIEKWRIGGITMKKETINKNGNSKRFQELLAKRRKLANDKKTSISKVSASDSQLDDTIKNFNEAKQYTKKISF